MLFKLLVATAGVRVGRRSGRLRRRSSRVSKPQAQPLDKALALRGGVPHVSRRPSSAPSTMGSSAPGLLASPSFFFGSDGLIPYVMERGGPGRHLLCAFLRRLHGRVRPSHFTDAAVGRGRLYMAVAGALMMPQWALCTMDDEGHNTLLWKIHTPVRSA